LILRDAIKIRCLSSSWLKQRVAEKASFRSTQDFFSKSLMNYPRFIALIPAAGVGARMGATVPKQYAELLGKPMLEHVMDTFVDCAQIDQIFVVVSTDDAYIEDIPTKPRTQILRCGGATRQASVTNGLQGMQSQVDSTDWILVHDAARPGLTVPLIDKLIAAAKDDPVGGLLALPVVDTIKRSDADGHADYTVSREYLWAAQTPQMFKHAQLLSALQSASHVTDEASAIEALGLKPKLVEGSPRNLKVTLPHDVLLAELYIKGIA
jgi:2-C-methyl-D-erythritol 4-phosphate cytidylyltransferase